MNNLNLDEMTEEEVIEYCRPLIPKIIRKYFSNHIKYMHYHMYTMDELIQFGMMGVLQAIRTYDKSKDVRVATHIINHIKYSVHDNSKQASLRNMNRYSYELVDMESLNVHVKDDERNVEILECLPSYEKGIDRVEDELFIKATVNKLFNEKSISKEYVAFLVYRLHGKTISQISKIFSTTVYHIRSILEKYRQRACSVLELREG